MYIGSRVFKKCTKNRRVLIQNKINRINLPRNSICRVSYHIFVSKQENFSRRLLTRLKERHSSEVREINLQQTLCSCFNGKLLQ